MGFLPRRRWLGRRRAARARGHLIAGRGLLGAVQPDPALPMFTDSRVAGRFAQLAREVFAEHGLECTYADGHLRGADGHSYGLTNVALLAASGDRRAWRGLLHQHVQGIVTAHAAPKQRELASVADRLHLRLWAAGDARPAPGAAVTLGGGLMGLACIDHPQYVETLTGAGEIELLGGWEGVRAAALTNLSRLRGDHVITVGESPQSAVQLSTGGFFNASRVFTMEHLLREDFLVEAPSHGVLFVVPNRHVVAVHPVTGEGMFAAIPALLEVARREHAAPGAVSPAVWFWCDGAVQQVTRTAEEGAVEVLVTGPLEHEMRALGLVDEQ